MTFLYRLTPGVCDKSYGMVVARMAGIPMGIVERASGIAEEFEKGQKWGKEGGVGLGKLAVFERMFGEGEVSRACLEYAV